MIEVADAGDPRVADYVDLNDPELRRRREHSGGSEGGFFVAEGALVVSQLLRSPYPLRSVLVTEKGRRDLAAQLAGVEAPVYLVTQELAERIAGFHFHRGALAAADRLPLRPVSEVVEGVSLVLVIEGVSDVENLGSLFRNAAAFGVGAVVLDPTCADPLYRRAVRVSMGHVLRTPFTRAARWPEALRELGDKGYEVVALAPADEGDDVWSLAPAGTDRRVALVVGSEGPGLSGAALAALDRRVRIPMASGVDSLNVATAAAIALHHLRARPRRALIYQS